MRFSRAETRIRWSPTAEFMLVRTLLFERGSVFYKQGGTWMRFHGLKYAGLGHRNGSSALRPTSEDSEHCSSLGIHGTWHERDVPSETLCK